MDEKLKCRFPYQRNKGNLHKDTYHNLVSLWHLHPFN